MKKSMMKQIVIEILRESNIFDGSVKKHLSEPTNQSACSTQLWYIISKLLLDDNFIQELAVKVANISIATEQRQDVLYI